jgi:hypothetical protein
MPKKIQLQKNQQKNTLNPTQITLDTPPGSPSTLTLDNFDEPINLSSSFTPQKRQKTGHTTRSKTALFIQDPLPAFSDTTCYDSSILEFSTSNEISNTPSTGLSNPPQPTNIDPFLDHSSTALASDFYHEFVEAVLVNAMPFYPINKDVFVTQGWDTKSGSSTVSF